MVCIIATIVPPELLRRTSLAKIAYDRREKSARNAHTLRFTVTSFRPAVNEQQIRVESYCKNHRELGASGPSRPRIAFWRVTPPISISIRVLFSCSRKADGSVIYRFPECRNCKHVEKAEQWHHHCDSNPEVVCSQAYQRRNHGTTD